MKKLMLIGGMSGFSIGMAAGYSKENGWPSMLWRASAAALAGGYLMKWWWKVCMEALMDARFEKAKAAKIKAANNKASRETQPK